MHYGRQILSAVALTLASVSGAVAQGMAKGDMAMEKGTTMVGGQAMHRTKDIVDNAVNSADHTTLVAAVSSLAATIPRP